MDLPRFIIDCERDLLLLSLLLLEDGVDSRSGDKLFTSELLAEEVFICFLFRAVILRALVLSPAANGSAIGDLGLG